MKKSIRLIVLVSVVALSTAPSFAAPTGGNPRPQPTSVWSQFVEAARAYIGI